MSLWHDAALQLLQEAEKHDPESCLKHAYKMEIKEFLIANHSAFVKTLLCCMDGKIKLDNAAGYGIIQMVFNVPPMTRGQERGLWRIVRDLEEYRTGSRA